jgi:hypothetical protein
MAKPIKAELGFRNILTALNPEFAEYLLTLIMTH